MLFFVFGDRWDSGLLDKPLLGSVLAADWQLVLNYPLPSLPVVILDFPQMPY
jgi:hypothetical protein